VWNWKFFLLALAANEASLVSYKVAKVYRENFAYLHLPPWARREPIPLIFHLTHFPLYWFNLILLVLGFFWLPWLTVLVVFGCSFLFGSLVLDVLVIGRFPFDLATDRRGPLILSRHPNLPVALKI
jgi:hypothetical protein